MIIIIIHEIGHLVPAIYYKWKIEKITILPFGGLTIFNEDINRPLKEEFIILITGPLFQIIFTYIMKNNIELLNISKEILYFNLLPIYPLDGSKIINIILNKICSFKKSHLITLYLSVITIIFLTIKRFNLITILIMILIVKKVIEEINNHHLIFNRFLLERYLKNYKFKNLKTIKNENQMKRDYRHIFMTKPHLTEKEYLKKRFDFHRKT